MGKESTQFKSGDEWNGNANGRPKGSISALSRLKKEFRENPHKFDEYMERYIRNPANEKHVMEMLDGKPRQNMGLDVQGGLAINFADVFKDDKQSC